MNYGIPYQGSKSKIIKSILPVFPKADHFYDLFGGGFAITHGMLVHRRNDYKHFHFNEIRPGMTELIQKAINGEYSYKNYKPKFVEREEFFAKKEKELIIKILWSFGNRGQTYLFGYDIADYKRSMHNAVVFNNFDELAKKVFGFDEFKNIEDINQRRLHLRNRIEHFRKTKLPDFLVKYLSKEQKEKFCKMNWSNQLNQLQQLQQLQQLEQLERLERLEKVNFYNDDYRKVKILDNSVVYCDIPYEDTEAYDKNKHFSHDEFYEWAANLKHPVFISEYNCSDKRFKCIWKKNKRSLMGGAKTKFAPIEKIFVNDLGYKAYIKHLMSNRKK